MRRLALLLLVLAAGCSGGTTDDQPSPFTGPVNAAAISLRNESDVPLVYVAAGEGTLALLDIRPTLFPHEYPDRLVEPGRTVAVSDIIGYQKELGVTFYVYLIDRQSGEARYSGFFVASAAELVRNEGLVRFTSSRL